MSIEKEFEKGFRGSLPDWAKPNKEDDKPATRKRTKNTLKKK